MSFFADSKQPIAKWIFSLHSRVVLVRTLGGWLHLLTLAFMKERKRGDGGGAGAGAGRSILWWLLPKFCRVVAGGGNQAIARSELLTFANSAIPYHKSKSKNVAPYLL